MSWITILFVVLNIYWLMRIFRRQTEGEFKYRDLKSANPFSSIGVEHILAYYGARVVKARGTVDERRLKHAKEEIIRLFGRRKASKAFGEFQKHAANPGWRGQLSRRIRKYMPPRSRANVLRFLLHVAGSTGALNEPDKRVLREICREMGIRPPKFLLNSTSSTDWTYSGNGKQTYTRKKETSLRSAYKTLGVDKNSSATEIKNAYRSGAKKHHPDMEGGNQAQFVKIKKAYEAIMNERGG